MSDDRNPSSQSPLDEHSPRDNQPLDNEAQRLAILAELELPDTEPEQTFDDIVELASVLCEVPMAACSLSDEERHLLEARKGLSVEHTGRAGSFCEYALRQDEPLIVEDVREDERFREHPFVVGPPHIRFYAGFQITLDEVVLGTLCVFDTRPRQLSATQIEAMQALTRQLEQFLRLRASLRRAELFRERHLAAGEELTLARLKYDVLFENSTDAIVISDLDGYLINCNQRLLDLLGYSYERMRGSHFSEFIPPENAEDTQRKWETWQTGEPSLYEVTFIGADGREIIVENSSALIDLGDRKVIQAILRDRTEERRAQRELEATRRQLWRAQKMESLGRLAGSVAHDFNNLINVISACSSFLLEDLPADDPRRVDAVDIHEAAEQSAALTSQLLAFSRQQVLESRVVHLDSVLERTAKLCRRVIATPVAFEVCPGAGHLEVYVDAGQLEQVIMNLVLNARDAVDGEGRIELYSRRETLGEHAPGKLAPGRYGVISVHDDGVGIPADIIDRIFEPFYTTKAEGKGTGLGLASVHGIVTQSGGYIDVASTPGRGSEFTIWLPEATAEQRAGEESAPEPPVRAADDRATLLFVDDNPLVRRSLVRGLERGGYHVLVASNGRDALDIWGDHRERIGAVVTDIIMPVMDGLELLERLDDLAPELPVLLLTGYSDEHDLGAAGASAHTIMRKPIAPSELCEVLAGVLEGEKGGG